jgi:hypothetical protein
MPERIQLRRTKGWRKPAGVISVVRGTDWGNPYRIGDDFALSSYSAYGQQGTITRPIAVLLFRVWIELRGFAPQIRRELVGRDLACWCPLDQPCHADVLLEIANAKVTH